MRINQSFTTSFTSVGQGGQLGQAGSSNLFQLMLLQNMNDFWEGFNLWETIESTQRSTEGLVSKSATTDKPPESKPAIAPAKETPSPKDVSKISENKDQLEKAITLPPPTKEIAPPRTERLTESSPPPPPATKSQTALISTCKHSRRIRRHGFSNGWEPWLPKSTRGVENRLVLFRHLTPLQDLVKGERNRRCFNRSIGEPRLPPPMSDWRF